jgi:4-amino-4-deoxy-L-arabinose transferase-like glycosyltransferase
MTRPVRTALTLAAIAATLYLPRLGRAPIYLAPDEVFIGLHAHSIATTGRDYGGRFLPLYIEYEYPVPDAKRPIRHGWLPPIIYYVMAAVLTVVPLSESAIRFPSVLVGVVDVVLMYFVGRRLFKREWLAVLAAMLLALTPAHLIHTRMAMDYVYPVPFVLAWLLGLFTYLDDGRERPLFLGTLALGIGVYSYIAAALVMPLYLLLTLVALAWQKRPPRAYAVAIAGFLLPALMHVPWLIAHPSALTDILSKYGVDDSSRGSVLQSVRGLLTFHAIGDQLSRLWTFFDPRFLFFDGPMELMYSTRTVGVFLGSLAILLVAGLRASLQGRIGASSVVLLVGLLIAPLAATLVRVTDAVYRALELLPFVVLLAVAGAQYLWSADWRAPRRSVFIALGAVLLVLGGVYGGVRLMREARLPGGALPLMLAGVLVIALGVVSKRMRLGQIIVVGLLAIVPAQFAAFYMDYFTDYQVRSSLVFSGNIRGALEEAIAEARQTNAPAIYLGRVGPYGKGGIYWKFYVAKHRAADLDARTVDAGSFEAAPVLKLAPGSIVVTNAGEGQTEGLINRLVDAGEFSKTIIKEPDGTPTFFVLRRTRPRPTL